MIVNSYTVLIDPDARTTDPVSHPQIRWSLVHRGRYTHNWLVTIDAAVAPQFEETMRELEAGGLILDWYQLSAQQLAAPEGWEVAGWEVAG